VPAAVALLKVAPESETEITPDMLKQAKAQIEKEVAAERTGNPTSGGVYIPDPRTKWDEAIDLLNCSSSFFPRPNMAQSTMADAFVSKSLNHLISITGNAIRKAVKRLKPLRGL
jgi:hypothetical protein